MAELKDHYENAVVLPLPELIAEGEKSAVANLISMGVDQLGMRISSTMPDVRYLPTKPGRQASEDRARNRRLATLGWWEENELNIKMRRRARWLIAYGSAPVVIRPDHKRMIPKWHLRDPLTTYPAPTEDPDDMCPDDVIFAYKRSAGWLRSMYGEKMGRLRQRAEAPQDEKFQIVEYMDAEETVLLVTGEAEADHSLAWSQPSGGRATIELDRYPNKCGYCPAVVPGRVTLDQPMGQFDSMIGLYQQQALLMALEVHAVKRGVFPDTYVVANERGQVEVLPASGIDGEIGVVKGGTLQVLNEQPGYQTFPTIDRLERAQRLSGGIPSELGGEAGTNIRTDRRGQSIMSAVIDFPVQEAQSVFARSLKWETKLAIATEKSYWGDTPKSFYVSWMGAKGQVDYTPNKDFENDNCFIGYAHPGADVNGLTIAVGQLMGTGMMSTRTAQELHPMIEDPEQEHDRSISEGLEQALLSSLQTQVADPNSPWQPMDVARVMVLVKSNQKELPEAIEQVQREAQERQATPVQPGLPEAQPGLAPAGMGQEQPTIEPPPADMQNLTSLLANLRLQQRSTPAEQAVA